MPRIDRRMLYIPSHFPEEMRSCLRRFLLSREVCLSAIRDQYLRRGDSFQMASFHARRSVTCAENTWDLINKSTEVL
jgi:hypothetical protein